MNVPFTRKSARQPASPRSRASRIVRIVRRGVLVAIPVFVLALWGLGQLRGGTPSDQTAAKLRSAEASFPYELASGMKLGSDSAPIKLVEYGDFQCPFCLRYTANQEPTLIAEYVKTGQVQIEFRNFPRLGDESVLAARGGWCAAEQNKFWQYHNRAYLTQAEAGQAVAEKVNVGRFAAPALTQLAQDAGLDTTAFAQCLNGDASLAAVQAAQREGQEAGIRGVPSFTLNGGTPRTGAPATLDEWRQLLASTGR